MNIRSIKFIFFALLLTIFPGCELVAGIFQAGLFAGIVFVLVIIALIVWAVKAMMNRK